MFPAPRVLYAASSSASSAYAVGVPDETDAFGRPLTPEEETDAFGAPVADWQPPVAPSVETTAEWRPPVSSTPGPPGEPAGWWRRAGAAVLDGLLVGVVAVVIALVASGGVRRERRRRARRSRRSSGSSSGRSTTGTS